MPKRSRAVAVAVAAPPGSELEFDIEQEEHGEEMQDDGTASESTLDGDAAPPRPTKAARLSSRRSSAEEGRGTSPSTADTATSKKLARKERNRLSAASSRARKREEDNELRARLEDQQAQITTLSLENGKLRSENETLRAKVEGMDRMEIELDSIRDRFAKLEQLLLGGAINVGVSSTSSIGTGSGNGNDSGSGSNQEVGSETHATEPESVVLQHPQPQHPAFVFPPILSIDEAVRASEFPLSAPLEFGAADDFLVEEASSTYSPSSRASVFLGSPQQDAAQNTDASTSLFADLDAVFGPPSQQNDFPLFPSEQIPFGGPSEFVNQQQQELYTPTQAHGFDWTSFLQPQPSFMAVA